VEDCISCNYSLAISRRWVLGDGKAALVFLLLRCNLVGMSELWFLCGSVSCFLSWKSTTSWLQSVSAHKRNTNNEIRNPHHVEQSHELLTEIERLTSASRMENSE